MAGVIITLGFFLRESAFAELKRWHDKRDVIVTRLDFLSLDFNDAYESAVESKVVAIQRAAEAKNKTIQIEEEAKQKIKTAEADAQAMRIKTAALSQSKSLVQYEAVQKWNGQLPKMMLGGQSIPMIDLRNMGQE